MAFENNPNATATITVTEPVVIVPGYNATEYNYGFENYSETSYPAEQVYTQDFSSGSFDSWTGSAGMGMGFSSGRLRLDRAAAPFTSNVIVYRDFTGLTVGRSYTLAADWMRPAPYVFNARIGNNTTWGTPIIPNTDVWARASYTFTATATTHRLYLDYEAGGASNSEQSTAYWDNITLTRNAYTVVNNTGMDGWSNGSVVSTHKRSGTYSLSANAPARAFTGLVVGHMYSIAAWYSTGGVWYNYVQTFQAVATSMSRTLNVAGTRYWDEVQLIHHVPAVTTLTPVLQLSDGDLTLDSSRYPYAEASVEVPLTSEDLVERIKPGQRVTINATSEGAFAKTYTPWVDQRRNLVPVTQPTAYAGSGWAAAGGSIAAPGWIGATLNSPTTGYIFTDGAEVPIAVGDKVTMTVTYVVTALGTGSTATHVRVVPHTRTANLYFAPSLAEMQAQQTLRPIVVGQVETVTLQWTSTVAVAAGQLDIALTSSADQGSFATVTGGFSWRATKALIEREHTDGSFFDGSSVNEEFVRGEWEGAVNASTSTLETRKIDTVTWVPAAGVTADLVLRERSVSHDGKTIGLKLASDEALLSTWADIADDSTPRTHEANLRNLVNYVLGKAIPGAALQSGTANADLTATWDAANLQTNPSAGGNLDGWTISGGTTERLTGISVPGTSITTAVRGVMSAGATGGHYFNGGDDSTVAGGTYAVRIREKQLYRVSAWVRTSVAKTIRLSVQQRNTSNTQSGTNLNGPLFTTTANTWHRLSFVFQAYPETVRAGIYCYLGSGTWSASQTIDMTGVTITEGTADTPAFDGSTTIRTDLYAYAWDGTPHLSSSKRTALVDRSPELFTWRAGDSVWKFLEPLTASAGLRLFCDEQRRWRLIDPAAWEVPGRFSARPDNTVEGTDTMDADDEDNGVTGVVAVFKWRDSEGVSREQTDTAGVRGKVKRIEFDRPFSQGVAAAHLTKVQGLGRVQDVTTKTDYSVRPGMEIQIDLPSTNAQLGTLTRVQWELTNGLQNLQSAGLRDTPPGAIDLLNGTIDALPGTIDSL